MHTTLGWPLLTLLPSGLVREEWRFLRADPLEPRGPQPEFPYFYSRRKSEASGEDNSSMWFFMLLVCTLIICKCLKK